MDDYGKILGGKVGETFQYLKDKGVLIKVAVKAAGFENVTVLTELEHQGHNPRFQIDPPEELSDALYLTKQTKLYFEFNGEDQLLYNFELDIENWQGDFWFPLPPEIKRIQRRRNFRLPAPMGTSLTLRQMVPPIKLLVLDFSLGGLLCMVETVRLDQGKRQRLLKGRTFNNLDLTFEAEEGDTIIRILRARIVRTGRNPKNKHDQYAFEFILIDRAEEKKLTHLLYGMQRKLLRRRVVLEE
ncbi:MAG: PilZ domain-containing protein [Desulfobacterales bacterium]|jgi:c-di-GMP-binding flagellar brake protein YcgR